MRDLARESLQKGDERTHRLSIHHLGEHQSGSLVRKSDMFWKRHGVSYLLMILNKQHICLFEVSYIPFCLLESIYPFPFSML